MEKAPSLEQMPKRAENQSTGWVSHLISEHNQKHILVVPIGVRKPQAVLEKLEAPFQHPWRCSGAQGIFTGLRKSP